MKDYTELLALAEIQKKEGKKEFHPQANFILSRSTKVVEELIKNTWLMKNAQAKIDRGRRSRMQLHGARSPFITLSSQKTKGKAFFGGQIQVPHAGPGAYWLN